eukprot:762907-Hanusia_phi.AAC.1
MVKLVLAAVTEPVGGPGPLNGPQISDQIWLAQPALRYQIWPSAIPVCTQNFRARSPPTRCRRRMNNCVTTYDPRAPLRSESSD